MTYFEKQLIAEKYYKKLSKEILELNPSWSNPKNFIKWCAKKIKSTKIKIEKIDKNTPPYYFNLKLVNMEAKKQKI